jgi:hypothetical protein
MEKVLPLTDAAFNLDAASMRLDDMSHQRQPQAGAGDFLILRCGTR